MNGGQSQSLLLPSFLETLVPDNSYSFCCIMVYFCGTRSQTFEEKALKVPVFQKNSKLDVAVCYCSEWTRESLVHEARDNQHPIDQMMGHDLSNRCGCEVNNPQGACCLGNVTAFVRSLDRNFSLQGTLLQ
ncbi:hypothetical protein BK120_23560 [Paenibacillus sp. FSL A5-0031]|nr:hypothetical protein BK120_23560 [Paenibacillus sp. FSL A5-0031]